MSALPQRLQGLLKRLEEEPGAAPSPVPQKIFVITAGSNIRVITAEVTAARLRLEDVHNRLDIALKAGLTTNTVH